MKDGVYVFAPLLFRMPSLSLKILSTICTHTYKYINYKLYLELEYYRFIDTFL